MQTVDQFAARAATLPGRLVEATPRAVRGAGAVLEVAARVNIAAATGGDMRLSRVRSGKGATIALQLRIQGAGRTAEAHVVPTGPIMLVEENTKAHRSPRQLKQRRRVNKRVGVVAFGGRVYDHVNHPGTRGKRPVRRAFQQSHDEAGRAGALVFATAARNHLGS